MAVPHISPVDSGTSCPPTTPGDISGKPSTALARLLSRIRDYLLLRDPDIVLIVLAAVAAHRLVGDAVWLLIVGPSAGAKTAILDLLRAIPGIFPLSDLTDHTLASGLEPEDRRRQDPSLLSRLSNEVLVFKDFTTVLSMQRDKRLAVLAQLREVYDGQFTKIWGTGKQLNWSGKLGFLAGVTPVVDKYQSVMGMLGQRFLMLRPKQADRQAVALRAMQNTSAGEADLRASLQADVAHLFKTLPKRQPTVPTEQLQILGQLADLISKARSPVERDGYSRDFDYVPEPEMPGRVGRQLLSLARGLAWIEHRGTVSGRDVARVLRVGLDSLPADRRAVIEVLSASAKELTLHNLEMKLTQYSETKLRRVLEDLHALRVVTRRTYEPTNCFLWSLPVESRRLIWQLAETPTDQLHLPFVSDPEQGS